MKLRHWIALFVLAFVMVELCDPSTPFVRVSAPVSQHGTQNHDVLDSPSTHSAIPPLPVSIAFESQDFEVVVLQRQLENQHDPATRKRPPIGLA